MNASVVTGLLCSVALAAASARVAAQELEPGVQTSTAAAPVAKPAAASGSPSAQPAASAAKPSATPRAGTATSANASVSAPAAPNTKATPGAAKGDKVDHLELDTTQVSGNRELPKVMYVVPWRRADLGEFAGRPPNSLLDEALAPVDRDVFRRQNRYYDQLATQAASGKSQPDANGSAASSPSAKDEK